VNALAVSGKFKNQYYMTRKKSNHDENIESWLTPAQSSLTRINFDLKCKNERQKQFVKLINAKDIVICAGPAGTGKTYIACAEALKLLAKQSHQYKKIIIVKSVTVLEGEEIGFLKGTMKEKMEPFMISFMDNFHKIIGKELTKSLEAQELIEIMPLAYIRGRSIDNTIIIVDEAQNISLKNMRSTMTRLGDNSKMIIVGDTRQIDIGKKEVSSLEKVVQYFNDVDEIGIMEFHREDIVRNPLIIKIEEIFENNS
jgi:phosphate starvation-inducible PhoH-like protein